MLEVIIDRAQSGGNMIKIVHDDIIQASKIIDHLPKKDGNVILRMNIPKGTQLVSFINEEEYDTCNICGDLKKKDDLHRNCGK